MRLIKFINESPKPLKISKESIPSIIRKDCRRYLNLLKPIGMPFMRGFGPQFLPSVAMDDSWIYKNKTRKNREPTLDRQLVVMVDKYLLLNGHHSRIKNALICTSEEERSKDFGEMFYIFPIKMKGFSFIRSRDFHFSSRYWKPDKLGDFIEDYQEKVEYGSTTNIKLIENAFEYLEYHFPNAFVSDKNIKEAYNNNYEIWFECDSYYIMDSDLKEFIKEEIMI